MAVRWSFLLVIAIAGSLSCGTRGSGFMAPDRSTHPDIRLELTGTPSGDPAQPVQLHAVIENAGLWPVYVAMPCPDPIIHIYDTRDRLELHQRDPNVVPICAAVCCLQPGERWEVPVTFTGRYYSSTGELLEAGPGTYEAIATFGYRPHDSSERYVLERAVTFTWR